MVSQILLGVRVAFVIVIVPKMNVQLMIISVFESNNSRPREKKMLWLTVEFCQDIFQKKSGPGSLYYLEDNKIGFNISFALFFFLLSTPYKTAYREIHGNHWLSTMCFDSRVCSTHNKRSIPNRRLIHNLGSEKSESRYCY